MRWILDDGPLDDLASVAEPGELKAYPSGHLLVAEATARGAQNSAPRSRLLATETSEGEMLFEAFEILYGVDDPAEEILTALHGEVEATVNLAESQAIAWAQTHGDDAVLVTADKRAALTALAELGRSRVAHPFDLWLDLLDEGVLSVDQIEDLCRRTRQKDQGLSRMPDRVSRRFAGG